MLAAVDVIVEQRLQLGTAAIGGEFNRSTQHYSPKLSGVGLKQFLH
jgi:hypothetical protein